MTQKDIHSASLLTHTVDRSVLAQKTAKLLNYADEKMIVIKPSWIQFILKIKFWYEVACFVVDHIKEIVDYINSKK